MKLLKLILKPIRAVLGLLWRIIRAPFVLARMAVLRRSERHKKKRERYSPYACIENLKAIGIEPEYVHVTFTEEGGISWEVEKGEKKEKKTKTRAKEKTE
jgi:hypothetical protein